MTQQAAALTALKQFPSALDRCQKALDLARDRNHQHAEAHAATVLGEIQYNMGDLPEAVATLTNAARVHEACGDTLARARALRLLGVAQADLGQTTTARQSWQDSLELYLAVNNPDAEIVRDLLVANS